MEQLRDEVIATLAEIDERLVRTWPGLNLPSETAAFSFEDDRYVFLEKDGSIHVHRLTDNAEIQVLKSAQSTVRSWPTFVPGGRFVFVASSSTQMKLWDLERRGQCRGLAGRCPVRNLSSGRPAGGCPTLERRASRLRPASHDGDSSL